jgi:hypothetical protein
MNPSNPVGQFKRRVALLFLAVLVAHLVISVYLTIRPQTATRNTFTTYYNRYLLPGPFFNERHIKIAPHLYISHKNKAGEWSDFTDFGIRNFSTFLGSPWRYDKLKESDYLRHIMRLAYLKMGERPFENYKSDREFIELNDYVKGELLPSASIDSIHMIYVFRNFSIETRQVKIDTVLNLQYNPADIVAGQ